MSGTDTRSYGHFCMLAKVLERVGDRWTLLVARDLMLGPKRFTDLMDRMAGITPKTLTRRLRELEADGLVEADREAGRREVWYGLEHETLVRNRRPRFRITATTDAYKADATVSMRIKRSRCGKRKRTVFRPSCM